MGPITIFDKSTLQSLSMDESVWLDAFFTVNVVPLFYVETLADLDKNVAEGKSPEDLVGMLAAKTPPNAVPNVHHRSLISAELAAGWAVPMDGRVPLAGGDVMRGPEGETGVHFSEFAETVALDRWKSHQFLEIEREIAQQWRAELVRADFSRTIGMVRNILPTGARIRDLETLRDGIEKFCDTAEREVVALALNTVGVPDRAAEAVLGRWEAAGRPTLEAFAPYTTHVFKVDLLYYLGIDRGLIAAERASNRVDMAYLYYLPFSMLFTSGDNLHRRTAPLFLRPDQSFAEAHAFKSALRELDDYFGGFPAEVKELGVMVFANYPPPALDNLVVQLWDKHMRPNWRDDYETPEQVLARWNAQHEVAGGEADFQRRVDQAQPVENEALKGGEPDYVVIRRQVPIRKGKWRLLPEEVEEAAKTGEAE
jgi:hypothetical protein